MGAAPSAMTALGTIFVVAGLSLCDSLELSGGRSLARWGVRRGLGTDCVHFAGGYCEGLCKKG